MAVQRKRELEEAHQRVQATRAAERIKKHTADVDRTLKRRQDDANRLKVRGGRVTEG